MSIESNIPVGGAVPGSAEGVEGEGRGLARALAYLQHAKLSHRLHALSLLEQLNLQSVRNKAMVWRRVMLQLLLSLASHNCPHSRFTNRALEVIHRHVSRCVEVDERSRGWTILLEALQDLLRSELTGVPVVVVQLLCWFSLPQHSQALLSAPPLAAMSNRQRKKLLRSNNATSNTTSNTTSAPIPPSAEELEQIFPSEMWHLLAVALEKAILASNTPASTSTSTPASTSIAAVQQLWAANSLACQRCAEVWAMQGSAGAPLLSLAVLSTYLHTLPTSTSTAAVTAACSKLYVTSSVTPVLLRGSAGAAVVLGAWLATLSNTELETDPLEAATAGAGGSAAGGGGVVAAIWKMQKKSPESSCGMLAHFFAHVNPTRACLLSLLVASPSANPATPATPATANSTSIAAAAAADVTVLGGALCIALKLLRSTNLASEATRSAALHWLLSIPPHLTATTSTSTSSEEVLGASVGLLLDVLHGKNAAASIGGSISDPAHRCVVLRLLSDLAAASAAPVTVAASVVDSLLQLVDKENQARGSRIWLAQALGRWLPRCTSFPTSVVAAFTSSSAPSTAAGSSLLSKREVVLLALVVAGEAIVVPSEVLIKVTAVVKEALTASAPVASASAKKSVAAAPVLPPAVLAVLQSEATLALHVLKASANAPALAELLPMLQANPFLLTAVALHHACRAGVSSSITTFSLNDCLQEAQHFYCTQLSTSLLTTASLSCASLSSNHNCRQSLVALVVPLLLHPLVAVRRAAALQVGVWVTSSEGRGMDLLLMLLTQLQQLVATSAVALDTRTRARLANFKESETLPATATAAGEANSLPSASVLRGVVLALMRACGEQVRASAAEQHSQARLWLQLLLLASHPLVNPSATAAQSCFVAACASDLAARCLLADRDSLRQLLARAQGSAPESVADNCRAGEVALLLLVELSESQSLELLLDEWRAVAEADLGQELRQLSANDMYVWLHRDQAVQQLATKLEAAVLKEDVKVTNADRKKEGGRGARKGTSFGGGAADDADEWAERIRQDKLKKLSLEATGGLSSFQEKATLDIAAVWIKVNEVVTRAMRAVDVMRVMFFRSSSSCPPALARAVEVWMLPLLLRIFQPLSQAPASANASASVSASALGWVAHCEPLVTNAHRTLETMCACLLSPSTLLGPHARDVAASLRLVSVHSFAELRKIQLAATSTSTSGSTAVAATAAAASPEGPIQRVVKLLVTRTRSSSVRSESDSQQSQASAVCLLMPVLSAALSSPDVLPGADLVFLATTQLWESSIQTREQLQLVRRQLAVLLKSALLHHSHHPRTEPPAEPFLLRVVRLAAPLSQNEWQVLASDQALAHGDCSSRGLAARLILASLSSAPLTTPPPSASMDEATAWSWLKIRLWLVQFDEDEGVRTVGEKVWESYEAAVGAASCVTANDVEHSLFLHLQHPYAHVRAAAAKGLARALQRFPAEVKSQFVISHLLSMYQEALPSTPSPVARTTLLSPSSVGPAVSVASPIADLLSSSKKGLSPATASLPLLLPRAAAAVTDSCFTKRLGVASALAALGLSRCLLPNTTEVEEVEALAATVADLVRFVLEFGAVDIHDGVRAEMVRAGRALIQSYATVTPSTSTSTSAGEGEVVAEPLVCLAVQRVVREALEQSQLTASNTTSTTSVAAAPANKVADKGKKSVASKANAAPASSAADDEALWLQLDRRHEAAVVFLGETGAHLSAADPSVAAITATLLTALAIPSEPVQLAVADCLLPLV